MTGIDRLLHDGYILTFTPQANKANIQYSTLPYISNHQQNQSEITSADNPAHRTPLEKEPSNPPSTSPQTLHQIYTKKGNSLFEAKAPVPKLSGLTSGQTPLRR
jgi:hypothetical protein